MERLACRFQPTLEEEAEFGLNFVVGRGEVKTSTQIIKNQKTVIILRQRLKSETAPTMNRHVSSFIQQVHQVEN